MSDHEETAAVQRPASPTSTKEDKDESAADSDKEMDTFEDAHDTAPETSSVRSLTRRTSSNPRPQSTLNETDEKDTTEEETIEKDTAEKDTTEKDESEEEHKKPAPVEAEAETAPVSIPEPEPDSRDEFVDVDTTTLENENEAPTVQARKSSIAPSKRLSVTSNSQLDTVSLDDDTPAKSKEEDVKMSPSEDQPKKTISLSSLTNALPWTPGAQASPTKNPETPPAVAPAPSSPEALPVQTQPAPPPPRKLASAFSWLSRSSSRDLTNTSPPPVISPRRNTGSSVTTLTSNPDMMLSKLEEEGGANGVNGNVRNSLKDRFKAMRMREEAGITSLPDDGDKNGIANLINKGPNGILATPVEEKTPPQSPNAGTAHLAPGTASGTAAGPSTLTDTPVDWDLWQSVVYEGPVAVAKTSAEELNRAIATGIPSAIRGVIWQVLAQSQSEELDAVYRDLVARGTSKEKDRNSNGSLIAGSNSNSVHSSASSTHSGDSAANGATSPPAKDESEASLKAQAAAEAERKKKKKEEYEKIQRLEKTIRRDLGARTAYSKFAAAQGLQEGLYGVCKAYALFDEEVGYAQGMNFLIMPLLFNMSEEEAFCLLVRLMNQYHLRDLFIQDMPGLHMHLFQFERLLEDTEPALYCHLRRRGISPHLYATQWFLTLFSYRFPLQLVLRIYDLIFSEGLSAILRFGIVLMQKNSEKLLSMTDMSHLTTYLRDRLFDVYIESTPSANSILENGFFGSSTSSMDKEVYRADQLVHDACEVKITPEILKFYRTEWEEKTKAEKEQQLELETLRSQNTSYSSKIRKLEDRLQAADREQADLATQLVHTKVENEELKDQNESLDGQVRELKIVIEKQHSSSEDQWKLERDALIERNQRVHEENEKLEKEMAELEEQLVQTKMQYAEINSQHETLLRKWNDLKRTFA
ncbi:GTPase-activating protein GYP5 [Cytospora mali]|uniref:GTPase-activating protein GYP5 n=1 Tax=Cytospora mali TaxID=578113 RepID=A0A194VCC7_CYTMA|nr:GTPase-activating protein GYP5 [Valsa mali var. pyri (nom. inval.)]